MTNIAIENGHRNSELSHEKWWFSIATLVYQRVTVESRVGNHWIPMFLRVNPMSLLVQPVSYTYVIPTILRSKQNRMLEYHIILLAVYIYIYRYIWFYIYSHVIYIYHMLAMSIYIFPYLRCSNYLYTHVPRYISIHPSPSCARRCRRSRRRWPHPPGTEVVMGYHSLWFFNGKIPELNGGF